ncbi:MAG: DNA-binding LytR/AlgR family response regulator [Bacteroidia bacterium]|jgi:two-component system response regulator LytT
MAKTSILVVEDESIVAKDIQQSLKKLGYSVPSVENSGEDAIDSAGQHRPDLILMDIMLKGEISGIEAAQQIKNRYQIPIIFLTAYADESTLSKAKVTEPYGYIIKPFKEIDLHTSIEMALYKHGKEQEVKKERDLYSSIVLDKSADDCIFVKSNSRLVKVKTNEMYFVEALKDYVIIYTKDAKYTVHSTMKDMLAKLSSSEFLRVHRSYIVRVDKIVAIEQNNLVIEDDKKIIPVGGSYRDELHSRLKFV